jgi:hypothetical protein
MLITHEQLIEVIKKAAEKEGSLAAFAAKIGMSRQGVENVTSGRVGMPNGKIAEKMGFRRVVMYERIKK